MTVPFLVKDIFPGAGGSSPSNLAIAGNFLYFTVPSTAGFLHLWRSDGTAEGTRPLLDGQLMPPEDITVKSFLSSTTIKDDPTFFVATTNGLFKAREPRLDLIRSFDSPDKLFDRLPFSSQSPRRLTALGANLFFPGRAQGQSGLWKSDGTAAGTALVRSFKSSLDLSNLTVVGNTLYFRADDGVNGSELWKSDGTKAGTVLFKDINPGSGSSIIANLTAVGNTLYFTADDGISGLELWRSDGTSAGTILVKDINSGYGDSTPRSLTVVGNTLFFVADDGTVYGNELWKSDGTAAGTVLVKDIFTGSTPLSSPLATPNDSNPFNLTAVGNTLFFVAYDNANGFALWKSDGTPSGTFLVKDIKPNSFESGRPQNLTAFGNILFFTVDDGINGNELWRSDGTTAGTVRVSNINPGAGSSDPAELTVLGNKLFFEANNGINGRELWALTVNTIAISNPVVSAPLIEGDAGTTTPFTFVVTRSGDTTVTNAVNWTVSFSGANSANILDFAFNVFPSGTVTFAPGETFKFITINIQGDNTPEADETFAINLSNATNGATITTASVIGTILLDDPFLGTTGNDNLNGTTGADPLAGLTGNDTYNVNNTGDVVMENPNEGTDTVRASVNYTLPSNVENLVLTGTANINGTGNALNNTLTGNTGKNILNGGAGADTLTGGAGADTLIFRFGESTVNLLGSIVLTDRITDFAIGVDKIDLLTQGGAATGAPVGFTRAADTLDFTINTIVNNVFADANGATAGNQALGINRAALVKANTSTYLIINDGAAGFQSANDLVINLTGFSGALPAFGAIPVATFFV